MAAIMLSTGTVLVVAETRTQVLNALSGAGAAATGTINGAQATIRASAVLAVADTVDGLRGQVVAPNPDPMTVVPPPA
jgi:hypothetical protein